MPTSGEPARTLSGHTRVVYAVAFSPDGHLLATTGADRTARLWQVPSGDPVRTLSGHASWLSAVAFSPDGRLLATATGYGTVRLLATAGSDRTARLWACPQTRQCAGLSS